MGLGGEGPDVPTIFPKPRPDEEAAPAPEGPEAASEKNGGGGIRTHKPVRAPHFEGTSRDATRTDENRRRPTPPRFSVSKKPTGTDSDRH